jgi:hypothetical protein
MLFPNLLDGSGCFVSGWDAIRCFFFVSLELLLRFLQQVGKDLPPLL